MTALVHRPHRLRRVVSIHTPARGVTVVFSGGASRVAQNLFLLDGRCYTKIGTPVAGTWSAGNVLWEATPTVGGPVGRLCTVAGTPGTWKTFGIIGEIRAAALADMGALTAPATFSAAYTKTESEALRTDVATLRTLVNTLLANRRTAGEQA